MGKMQLGFLVSLKILLFHMELGICDLARNSSLGCVKRERTALLRFRATLSDPSNRLSSWNSNNKDCCAWESITCHRVTGHVIALDLNRPNTPNYEDILEAKTVDSSLLELKHLSYLDLSIVDFNYFKFPAYLGSLKQLQYLNLSGTFFSGVVPQHLGNLSRLRTLDLTTGGVDLKVDDLMWASRLSSLQHLDMSGVNLSNATHVFEVLKTIPSLLVLNMKQSELGNTHLPISSINDSTFLPNLQHLDLSQNSFKGEFPCFLPNMTSLRFLDLSWNMFNFSVGTHLLGLKKLTHLYLVDNNFNNKVDWISEFLGDKRYLKSLDLSHTGISGDISRVFKNLSSSQNLESLSLGGNQLYGELPQELGELHHLMNLHLQNNLLYGPIPTSLGKLSALISLDISSNNFSNPLPSSIANLTSLKSLSLSKNRLSGEIPTSLGELSNLESIDMSFNCFKTTLSEAHFANLSKLEEFEADNNMIRYGVGYDWVPPFQLKSLTLRSSKIGGQFPQWLQTQKELSVLDLSNCSITGSLPAWLHSMTALDTLDVSHNNISGKIPKLSSIMWILQFSDNMITHLPSNIGHMIPLVVYLNLARNMINGSIPDSLCRMKELVVLDLSKNHLTGTLPNCWPSNLEVASLSSNELTGVIPNSIGGARSLWRLHLNANSLTGQLPSTLKNCKSLDFLDVGGNNLSGKIPKWLGKHIISLEFLRLRNNNFSGTIPRELCELSHLQVMDLANNNLTGNIPHCFGNFSAMMINNINGEYILSYGDNIMSSDSDSLSQVMKGVELEYSTNYKYVLNLDLSCNHLAGRIPRELANLSGLVGLNLSHNHLGGEIPANIGDMKSLESLDLSNNNLQGIIPYTLSNLNFLSRLDMSNNNFSGQIPDGRQLQTLNDPSIYQGNPLLCGPPLQRKCKEAGIAPDIKNHEEEEEDDEDRVDKIWFYGIIIAGFASGFWAVIGVMVVKTKWRQAYFRYIELVMAKMLGY